MNNFPWVTFWTALAAIGSFAVAIMAIWGDIIRSRFIGPKLKLFPHNLEGNPTTLTEFDANKRPIKQYQAYFYHLIVKNSRAFISAKNCRVILKQIHRRGPDGEFHPEKLVVPLQYTWSPAEWSPALQTVAKEEVLYFGRISEGDSFIPTFYITSVNFKGLVKANESIRYSLQIVADNFVSSKLQIFEVSWNGQWGKTSEEMKKNWLSKKLYLMNRNLS